MTFSVTSAHKAPLNIWMEHGDTPWQVQLYPASNIQLVAIWNIDCIDIAQQLYRKEFNFIAVSGVVAFNPINRSNQTT